MSKKSAEAALDNTTNTTDAATDGAEAVKGGHKIILPNGVERITFIRDSYYNGPEELKGNRSAIKNAINKMYEDAGQKDGQIPYQIVFAATKTEADPRIASAANKAAKAEAKAKADAEAKAAKAAEAAATPATAEA